VTKKIDRRVVQITMTDGQAEAVEGIQRRCPAVSRAAAASMALDLGLGLLSASQGGALPFRGYIEQALAMRPRVGRPSKEPEPEEFEDEEPEEEDEEPTRLEDVVEPPPCRALESEVARTAAFAPLIEESTGQSSGLKERLAELLGRGVPVEVAYAAARKELASEEDREPATVTPIFDPFLCSHGVRLDSVKLCENCAEEGF